MWLVLTSDGTVIPQLRFTLYGGDHE